MNIVRNDDGEILLKAELPDVSAEGLDISVDNLPAGTRLAIGEAVIEVTEEPHTGCNKFSARFGSEAIKFVNKSPGRELRLRGLNAVVITPGTVRVGDAVTKL